MRRSPYPGYVAGSGDRRKDRAVETWGLGSLVGFMRWLIAEHRKAWSGRVHVLHAGYGLRDGWGPQELPRLKEVAEGNDWRRQIAAYPDSRVLPWLGWLDGPVQGREETLISPAQKLRALAAARSISWLGGENAAGADGAAIDWMHGPHGPLGDGGYTMLMWVDWPSLIRDRQVRLERLSRWMRTLSRCSS
jgi:hypothetical protein